MKFTSWQKRYSRLKAIFSQSAEDGAAPHVHFFFNYHYLFGIVIITVFGFFLRFTAINPSALWLDDLWVALNGKAGLKDIFAITSSSPILFSFITHFNYRIFKDPEWSVQLFPFVCGVIQIPLMAYLVHLLTRRRLLALVAALFAAVSPPMVVYSAHVKQYMSDSLTTIVLLINFVLLSRSGPRHNRIIWFSLLGMICALLSYTSIILTIVFINLYLFNYIFAERQKTVSNTVKVVLSVALFNGFIAFFYFFFLRMQSGGYLTTFWKNNFIPLETTGSENALNFIYEKISGSVESLLTPRYQYAIALVLPGLWFYLHPYKNRKLRTHRHQNMIQLIGLSMVLHFLAALVLAMMRKYPLGGIRTDIYQYPIIILLIVTGMHVLLNRVSRWKFLYPLILAFALYVFLDFTNFIKYDVSRKNAEYVALIERNLMPGDIVITYPLASHAYGYYTQFPIAFKKNPHYSCGFEPYVKRDNVYMLPFIRGFRGKPILILPHLKAPLAKKPARIFYFSSHITFRQALSASQFIREYIIRHGYRMEEYHRDKDCELALFVKPAARRRFRRRLQGF